MKKLISVLIFLTTLSITSAFSQDIQEAKYKYTIKEWNDLIKKCKDQIRKTDYPGLDQCITSVSFATFNIDANGHVINLKVSEIYKARIFEKFLAMFVNATDGSWLPETINGKPVTSKLFILPYTYNMEAACNPDNKQSVNSTGSAIGAFFSELNKHTDRHSPITQLNCVILEPVTTFSQADYPVR